MKDLILQASDDLVTRLARERDPIRAVVELVWNPIDGEADAVRVLPRRTDMEAIDAVIVEDDGHGITSDEVESTFGRIAGSWKALSSASKNGKRSLHGKLSEGRLSAFALGSRVTWVSESINTAGVHETVTIEGDRDSGHVFHWDALPSTKSKTGTRVTALNEQERSLNVLASDVALPTLRAHFAPALLNDTALSVTFDGATLDPAQEMLFDTPLTVPFEDNPAESFTVRIIEWRTEKHRALYFGKDDQHFLHEASGSELESLLPYSAYITEAGLDDNAISMLGLGDLADDVSGSIWRSAKDAIREHTASPRREKRRDQVQQWKQTGVYPYKGEAKTGAKKAERAVFDVVSSAIVPQISKGKSGAQVVLSLVRDALRTDPENLGVLLSEYVALSEVDRKALTRLLTETTLTSINRSANLVTGRNKFLAGLEHLIFDPDDSPDAGERDHLHKRERKLWICGEEYYLMNSERGLTEMLRTHLKLEGLPTAGVEPVKRWDGKSGRADLHLAAKFQEHDRIRLLVVELKAPTITAGRKERDQVEGYANVVASNAAFASDKAIYDFVLVVTDFDDVVNNSIKSENRELGLLFVAEKKAGHPLVRTYVRRWRDIIDENRRRLEFVTSSLEHDPSLPEGLAFLREQYSDLLPPRMRQALTSQLTRKVPSAAGAHFDPVEAPANGCRPLQLILT